MSTNNSPAPWRAGYRSNVINDRDGKTVCQFWRRDDNEYPNKNWNVKRIVECVNAMEGFDDPSNLRATWDAIQHLDLHKYKDLKEAVQSLIDGIDNGMHMKSDSIIVEALRQAIQ